VINDFPISEATAKLVASEINRNVQYAEATVVGRGKTCFVKVVRQVKRSRNLLGPPIKHDVIEMIGRKQERMKR